MFDDPPTQNDHAGPGGPDSHGVDTAHIVDNIDAQPLRGGAVGVEVEHIAQGAVGQGGTKDRDVVPSSPVQNRVLVVDFAAETFNDLAGGPMQLVLLIASLQGLLLGGLLFLQHLIQDGDQPIFKCTVVAVRDDEVADAVQSFGTQPSARGGKGAHVGGSQAFNEIFLHSASRGDNGGDVTVADQVADGVSKPGGDEVGGVSEKDGGLLAGLRMTVGLLYRGIARLATLLDHSMPRMVGRQDANHLVDDAGGFRDRTALKPGVFHVVHHLGDRDVPALEPVKVDAADLVCPLRHGFRGDQHGIGDRRGRGIARGGVLCGHGC